MLLGSPPRLLVLLPTLAHAFPRASSSALATSTSVPSYLQPDVPDCAQPCLQTILREEYPSTCASAGDIACYCTQYTSSGLTLGEAAYECAVASCGTSSSKYSSIYSICDGIAAAVPATHSTLTFTAPITRTAIGSTGTGSLSTPTTPHNSTIHSTSTPTANLTAHASASTSKQTPSSTSARASSTRVPFTTATAAGSNSTASYGKDGLSNSAVAGITVGGVAGAALLVAAVFFVAWLRKRHRKKNDDVLEKRDRDIWSVTPPADQGPDHLEPSDLAALGSLPRDLNARPGPPADARDPRSVGGVGVSLPQATVDRGWTIRLRTPSPPAESIGLAISQDPVAVDAALASPASTRTVSQLLPDKPEPAHHANGSGSEVGHMVQPSAAVVAVRPQLCRESSQTVFEEDSGRQWRRESAPYPGHPPPTAQSRASYQHPQYAEDYVQSPEALQPPGLPLAPPAPAYGRNTWPSPPPLPSPLRIQRPPPATAMTTDRPVLDPAIRHPQNPYVHVTQASSSSGGITTISSSGSVSQHPTQYTTSPSSMTKTPPEHYTPHVPPQSTIRRVTQWPAGGSPPPPQAPTTARIPTPPQFLQHSPSRYQAPTRKPVPAQRKRASTASLTSIESASPNDPSPPEDAVSAAKQLTPPESHPTVTSTPPPVVSQSPHDVSPISDLRYPKVPRASNQAVPRGGSGDGHSPNSNANASLSSSESTPVAIPFNRSQAPSPSPAPQTQSQAQLAAAPTSYAANTSKALAARRLGPGAAEHLAKGLFFNNPQPDRTLAPPQQHVHPPSQHYPYPFPFHYQGQPPNAAAAAAAATAAAAVDQSYAYPPPAPPYTTVFHNGSSGMLSAGPPSSQQTGRTDRSSHASGGGDAVVPWKDPDRYSRVPGAARNDSSDSSGSACSGGKITVAGTVVLHEGHGQGQRGSQGREAWERYRAGPPPQTQHAAYHHGYGQGYGGGGEVGVNGALWSPTGTATRLTPTREGGDSGDLVLRVGMHPAR